MNYDDIADDVQLVSSEPVTPPLPIATDRSAVAIRSSIDRVESAISEFDRISAGLADLHARFPVDLVYDATSTKGMAEAVAHRAAWREPRINVEKVRKIAKAPVLALGKDIDARAAWLTEQLLLGEEPVDRQIKAEEARKEEIKRQKADAEFARLTAIQEALHDLAMEANVAGWSSDFIAKRLADMRARVIDPLVFQEMIGQAEAARTSAVAKLEMAHKAALHTEAEAARVVAERKELEELRAAQAEQKRKDAEAQAAEAARVAEQRRKADEERIENERVAAELAAQRAEIERQAAELRQRQADAEARRVADEKVRAKSLQQARLNQAFEATFARCGAERTYALRDAYRALDPAGRVCPEEHIDDYIAALEALQPATELMGGVGASLNGWPGNQGTRAVAMPDGSEEYRENSGAHDGGERPATITTNAQESGSLPAAAGACTSSGAEAADVPSSGSEGKGAHAEERAPEPSFDFLAEFAEFLELCATGELGEIRAAAAELRPLVALALEA